MKQNLETLIKRARQSTVFRGHRMKWTRDPDEWIPQLVRGNGVCRDCGMEVQCNPDPPPNGIDIGGEAVALNCTGKRKLP